MKTETKRDVTYYEGLPYTLTIRKDDEGDFVARIAELPGCTAHGESEIVAIENLHSVQRLWIEEALSAGNKIPEPEQHTEMPSGKWIQRVPRRLHKQLANAARLENVSLNQLVTSMLSEALAFRTCERAFDVYLSKSSASMHHMRDDAYIMCWRGPARQEAGWAVDARPQLGNISETLARVGKIRSSDTVSDAVEVRQQWLASHSKEKQLASR